MAFTANEHLIKLERKSKKKDAQGRETWITTVTEYLPVQWRLAWFRAENPKGRIDSTALSIDLTQGAAVFEAYVEREDGGAARMHGSETREDWKDFIEKAQTKALGRALAAAGYGTQFTDDEFAEGEHIADAPVARTEVPVHPQPPTPQAAPPVQPQAAQAGESIAHSPITEQQRTSIEKICAALGQPTPIDYEKQTYLQAKETIQRLTALYRQAQQAKKEKKAS